LRQPVHAEDLAIGALAAAASPAAANKIYAIQAKDTITYREMVGTNFDGLHKPRRIHPNSAGDVASSVFAGQAVRSERECGDG